MDKAYPSILFTDGLPVETLRNISTIGQVKGWKNPK